MRKYNLLVSKFVIKGMELVYIYHSGFALLGDGYTVIMDYYRDTEDKQAEAALRRLMNEQPEEPVVAPEQGKVHDELLHRPGKLYVLASHFHPDHFNKEVLDWKTQRPDIIYIFSKDILRHRRAQKEDAVWLKKERNMLMKPYRSGHSDLRM